MPDYQPVATRWRHATASPVANKRLLSPPPALLKVILTRANLGPIGPFVQSPGDSFHIGFYMEANVLKRLLQVDEMHLNVWRPSHFFEFKARFPCKDFIGNALEVS